MLFLFVCSPFVPQIHFSYFVNEFMVLEVEICLWYHKTSGTATTATTLAHKGLQGQKQDTFYFLSIRFPRQLVWLYVEARNIFF